MLDPSQNRVARSSMAHSSNRPGKQLSAHRSAQGGAVFDLDYFTCDRCSNEEFLRLLRKVVAHHDVRNMYGFCSLCDVEWLRLAIAISFVWVTSWVTLS